jgi:phosphoglycerate kinase
VAKLTIEQLDLAGRRVFLRADLNVPLEGGAVGDDTRLRAVLPTIQHALNRGAAVVLASHLGRPQGVSAPQYSLRPVAERLETLLAQPVPLAPNCVGPEVTEQAQALKPGQVLLLENLRFHAGEEANDEAFAQALAELADCYVNDAFAAAHRAHASIAAITRFLQPAAAGLLLQKELDALTRILERPQRPLVAVLGGAKVSDKIQVIESLLPRVDALLIGGGMAYTFFRAQGLATGKSLVEEDKVGLARTLLENAKGKIRLPADHVVASAFKEDADRKTLPVADVPEGWMGLDIGPATALAFGEEIRKAKLVLWNGPMGVFEMKPFAEGTLAVARALADSQGTSIVGGGDSVAAITQMGLSDRIDHVSTGGGASLEFLAGDEMPGVACLQEA